MELLIALIVGMLIAGGTYWWWSSRHTGTCQEPTCKQQVRLQLTNVSPCGPNPLGIYATMGRYHCKSCGKLGGYLTKVAP